MQKALARRQFVLLPRPEPARHMGVMIKPGLSARGDGFGRAHATSAMENDGLARRRSGQGMGIETRQRVMNGAFDFFRRVFISLAHIHKKARFVVQHFLDFDRGKIFLRFIHFATFLRLEEGRPPRSLHKGAGEQ